MWTRHENNHRHIGTSRTRTRVSYFVVRILVTNDDGIHSPGLSSLVRAIRTWALDSPPLDSPPLDSPPLDSPPLDSPPLDSPPLDNVATNQNDPESISEVHQIRVVAPLSNHSGAGAAIGDLYERDTIAYQRIHLEGIESSDPVEAFGLDASPALCVLMSVLGALGPRPDVIISGINLGANLARSVLHSGTVGAVLTGAQLGVNGAAVSMRSDAETSHWESAAHLAVGLIPTLYSAQRPTVLNLNVPSLPLSDLKGIRAGRAKGSEVVKAAFTQVSLEKSGEIQLRLSPAVPKLIPTDSSEPLGPPDLTDASDALLLAHGFASISSLHGPFQLETEESFSLLEGVISQLTSGLNAKHIH